MRAGAIATYLYQLIITFFRIPDAYRFLREHRLWRGLDKYGWVIRLLVAAGLLLSLKMGSVVFDWWQEMHRDDSAALSLSHVGGLVQNVANEGYELFTAGFMKYVILILLEVIVFHIMRGTLAILAGRKSGTTLQEFIDAQVRMIKVVFRSWILELILTTIISVIFGIFGFLSFLEGILIFGVQCYYLGFVILDNFTEQFDLTIKESVAYAQDYIGVSLALGFFLYVVMLVPLVGALVGPVIASITAVIVMLEQGDLHLRQPEPVDLSVESGE